MLPPNCGKLLDVDLAAGTTSTREVSEETLCAYLGGSGLAARLLYDGLDAAADPLAPEAALVVMNGLLTGVPAVCGNKVSVCARSPLTGL